MVLLCFVIIGILGGVLIKTLLFDNNTTGGMPNDEANRLISYLGISDYELNDRLGSSFTAKYAKKLLEAAGVSFDKVDVDLEHIPGFMPLTRKQFERIYDSLIQELELSRLQNLSLYIYDIDTAQDKEIDGIVYELVNTSAGDYYMEKAYGMDSGYIGKVVSLYVSNNEIILCLGEDDDNIVIRNAYASKISEEDGDKSLFCYVNGKMQKLPLTSKANVDTNMKGRLCDITINNKGVTQITDHTSDLVSAKVSAYEDGAVTVEGYEGTMPLSEVFNVFKVNGTFKAMQSAGTLIGYSQVSLYIVEGVVEAALITEDIYAKNIRVLINDSEFSNYYHNEVRITSDTPFSVSYGDKVKEYALGKK